MNKQRIIKFMDEQVYRPLKFKELVEQLEVTEGNMEQFQEILNELTEDGTVIKTRSRRFGLPHKMNLVVGHLQGHSSGFAFLISERHKEDTFIAPENLNGAMHGDKVVARMIPSSHISKNKEGEIIRIIERARTELVGRMDLVNKDYGFVVPDNQRISKDFYVHKKNFKGAKNGDKVVAEILEWPKANRSPEAKIKEVLGKDGDPGVDTLSVIHEYKLSTEFPKEVLQEAKKVAKQPITANGRRDLRNQFTFTIDGADAKDLDDAITIEKTDDGIMLGIHIADVGYYVKKDSLIDIEAFERGTSVYFPDRVLPMLPQELSNGVCSLHPEVDRLTVSVIMKLDENGNIKDSSITESIINSDRRLTYDLVNKLVVDKDQQLREEYQDCIEALELSAKLAVILREKRMQRGSIDFDFAESKIEVDQVSGRPVNIRPRRRTFSDGIIEEFMLLANETIAEHFYWLSIPFMYRVHDEPLSEKLSDLTQFLANFNIYLKGVHDGEVHPKEFQKAIKEAEGRQEEKLINTVILRSMQRAVYSDTCDGHFGLASDYYTHFTSPIRRYPDLVIHRIIKDFLNDNIKVGTKKEEELSEFVAIAANKASARERVADEAERSILDLLKVEFMAQSLYNEYDGLISGVIPSGFFVELENTVEGFVHVSTLFDDYYLFEKENYRFIGERTGNIFRLGDKVRIKVVGADVQSRKIDFKLVDMES
jgi:ribonuclease R